MKLNDVTATVGTGLECSSHSYVLAWNGVESQLKKWSPAHPPRVVTKAKKQLGFHLKSSMDHF